MKNIYRDVGVYDMCHDEFKELCRNSWKNSKNMYVLIDIKRRMKEDTVFVMKAKTQVLKLLRKQRFFD